MTNEKQKVDLRLRKANRIKMRQGKITIDIIKSYHLKLTKTFQACVSNTYSSCIQYYITYVKGFSS